MVWKNNNYKVYYNLINIRKWNINSYNLKFVISAIKNVSISSNNRQLVYSIDLVSEEAYENSKMFVSHAYKESIENIMNSVLTTYLKTKKIIILHPLSEPLDIE